MFLIHHFITIITITIMDFLFYSFSESRIKPQLKMAIQRIKIMVNKKASQLKHQKREIALMLSEHKTEKARIKVTSSSSPSSSSPSSSSSSSLSPSRWSISFERTL